MTRWLNIALFAAALLAGYGMTVYFDSGEPAGKPVPAQVKSLPGFSFTDLEGRKHDLKDFTGKIIILNFWASWCAPCVQEFPALLRIARENKGLVLIALSSDAREEDIQRFMRKQTEPTPNVYIARDAEDVTLKLFGISRLPETIIADQKLQQRHKLVGAAWEEQELQKMIESLR